MKTALIDPTTQVQTIIGWEPNPDPTAQQKYLPIFGLIENSARVCEIVAEGAQFPVALPLFWADCADDVGTTLWYYDTQTAQFVQMPPIPPVGTEGVQTV